MKKIFLLLTLVILGFNCLAQLPTQYIYVNDSCEAIIPDYLAPGYFVISDNCDLGTVTQTPIAGTVVSTTTIVTIDALDLSGNPASESFDVVLLDSIAPSITVDPNYTGYTDEEIVDMYRTFYTWAQVENERFHQVFPWDSLNLPIPNTKIFYNTIPFPDTTHLAIWAELLEL
jgi:hypothetical protein